jgi:hypothetical protein
MAHEQEFNTKLGRKEEESKATRYIRWFQVGVSEIYKLESTDITYRGIHLVLRNNVFLSEL